MMDPLEMAPAAWGRRPLWSMFHRRKDLGHPDEPLLSVFREHGVVARGEHVNHNQAAENRNIYQLVDNGWFVVNRMKAWQGSVGISFMRGIVSGHYICFEPTHGESPRYLNWLLRSDPYTRLFETISRGVRPGQAEIDNDDLDQVKVLLPPLDDQRRIAVFLDDQVARIDNIVAAREMQVELLGDQFRALLIDHLSAASRADRRPSRLTWLGTIPTKWGEPRICQVARIGTGHTPSRSRPELWQNCTIPWLTTSDVHRFRQDEIESIGETAIMISQSGLENSAAVLHPKGTVALSRTASAGFSIVMARDMATSQDFGTWTCGPRLVPHFLLWCLRAMRSDIMGRLAIGSTHKTIYFPDLMSIRIPLPTLREQNDIVLLIQKDYGQVSARAALHRELVRRLGEMKRSLITAAVTGEFDVSAADGSRVPIWER